MMMAISPTTPTATPIASASPSCLREGGDTYDALLISTGSNVGAPVGADGVSRGELGCGAGWNGWPGA